MKKSELKQLIRHIVNEVRKSKSLREGVPGAHPGASKWDDEAGYDIDDPKHPGYIDRLAGTADMNDRGEEDMMLGLTHDDSEPVFEDKKFGASTLKKSSDKKDNTQMGYEDKTITSTSTPKEKKEGKKLPVKEKGSNTETNHFVKKTNTATVPAGEKKDSTVRPKGGNAPEKDGGMPLKEMVLQMIRESLEEMAKTPITLDASGIVRGGVPVQYRVPDKDSVTGWSLKGYTQRFPDGTPVEAPKNTGANYKKVGTTTPAQKTTDVSGEEDTESAPVNTGLAATKRTEDAVAEFMKYNPDAQLKDVVAAVEASNSDETPHNTSPNAIKKAMDKVKADAAGEEAPIPAAAMGKKMSYTDLRNRLLKAKLKANPAPKI